MEWGCQALSCVPQRFGTDEAVMRAFESFTMACQLGVHLAMTRHAAHAAGCAPTTTTGAATLSPTVKAFAPSEGALQSTGELARKTALRFCYGVSTVLVSEPVVDALSALKADEEIPAASVRLQREYLEHVGIEANFGCQALSRVPQLFSRDAVIMRAFQVFTSACQLSVNLALVHRAHRKA
uniref:Uncharacterized protein n=1 Tax=Calcidiscus leptoporus TaxID=127549 RepID=A0A7S0IM81_9EUKA|mmetsp:Transcript_13039/g.30036  ORF Transcript_13039/g.30036 Transcript_13039/m.30036 type:complete len:182 (+) Transcript_13039:2-547(+)